LLMHLIFRKEEMEKANDRMGMPEPEVKRALWQNAVFFAVMIGVLVFSNWGAPNDFEFKLKNGDSFRAAVVKAPEDTNVEGAAYRVKYLEGTDQGKELELALSSVAEKTPVPGTWNTIWRLKWHIASGFAGLFALVLVFWFAVAWWKLAPAAVAPALLALTVPAGGLWVLLPFSAGIVGLSVALAPDKGEGGEWFAASWGFAKQIMPLLLFGVVVAGFLLGRPDHEGLIPGKYVEMLVGDRPDAFFAITGWGGGSFESIARAVWPVWTNFFASVFGAFMYFATLTEVPILQGLIGSGMGKGPALALLLAGPALSLPNMLVIRSIMGTKKTVVFVSLVIVMATVSGILFGAAFNG
ncbi:MAG: permease, partial [Planctomycetota bacterium]